MKNTIGVSLLINAVVFIVLAFKAGRAFESWVERP
jgi:hypothetical protein